MKLPHRVSFSRNGFRRAEISMAGRTAAMILLALLPGPPAARGDEAPRAGTDDAGDTILRGAAERIERHRKGPIRVRVVDRKGEPVAGAEVRFTQQQHEFLFGCNIFRHGRHERPRDEEAYRSRFAALFNFATLPYYWRGYEPRKGEPEHADRERIARWCREQGIVTKGHPLVWNHPASVPGWLPARSREVQALSEARVEDCVRRFRGLVDIWDVVNEATDPWRFDTGNRMTAALRELRPVPWTVRSFLAARRAHPDAVLVINDYRVDDDYAALITQLRSADRRVYDAIGIQSHMHRGCWSPERTWEVCEKFARFGVPLHFTETTIVSGRRAPGGRRWGPSEPDLEEVQARDVVTFYSVLFSHPAVEAITWWDLADLGAWQGAPAGLLGRDLNPKPAYARLLERVRREWWTGESRQTDRQGVARIRGFFGTYRIEARREHRRAVVTRKHPRRPGRLEIELVLEEDRQGAR